MLLLLGTRPGNAAVVVAAPSLDLAVPSFPFAEIGTGFESPGEAVRELGVAARDEGAVDVGVSAAALDAVLARRAASRRRREAGDPGRRWARRERWLTLVGGFASLGVRGVAGIGRGRAEAVDVGDVQGLDEGLGHLEDGSGQTGLRG